MLIVFSIDSRVVENLFANNMRKYNQEMLNVKGVKIFTMKIFKTLSLENHTVNSVRLKTRKIIIGTKIIVIKMKSRLIMIPLTSLDTFSTINYFNKLRINTKYNYLKV